MTPDDRSGSDDPTKPLPVDPDGSIEAGSTEPLVAPHVPVADVSTAQLGPVGAGAMRPDRSRAFTWGLIAAVAVLGITVIVILTLFLQNGRPTPALTPDPSSSPTVTPLPTEGPPIDVPETPEDDEPEPEPTTPPEPTEPPDPEPTETTAPAAP